MNNEDDKNNQNEALNEQARILQNVRKKKHEQYLKWSSIKQEKEKQIKHNDLLLKKLGSYLEINIYKRSGHRIINFLKKYFFKEVVNIDPEMIPGIYRKRVLLNQKNLKKPKEIIEKVKVKADLVHDDFFGFTYATDEDQDLNMAILESLKDIKKSSSNNTIDKNLFKINDGSNDMVETDEDENKQKKKKKKEDIIIENFEYWVCLDLRIYGPEPGTPIYVDNKELFLDSNQKTQIKKEWDKIFPEDCDFLQDLSYYKMETKQMEKDNLFCY